jgi:hypothetical protein
MQWRNKLEAIESLGSQDSGVTCLADLHEARKRHLSQFFTPLAVVEMMWKIAGQSFHHRKLGAINLLDTSIGSGRLMHFATPDQFNIAGVDIHREVVTAVMADAEAAGFDANMLCAGMQDVRPKGFDIALLNPPFSISLESAALSAYPCTRHGRLGPGTTAQSDEYALAQGLDAASVVIAVVPQSLARDLQQHGVKLIGEKQIGRLRAILSLGGSAFKEEGATVETCVVVFGHDEGSFYGWLKPTSLCDIPDFALEIRERAYSAPKLRPVTYDSSEPAIKLPVTGCKDVRVVHSGRKIGLLFSCGGMQARVLNAVYRQKVSSTERHRLPAGVKFAGQGLLDVQVILATPDPQDTFAGLLLIIRNASGVPLVDPGLQNHLTRLIRSKPRLTTPFGHWVFQSEHAGSITAVAKCRVPSDAKFMMAPAIKTGQSTTLTRIEDGWSFTLKAWTRKLCNEEAMRLFEMPKTSEGWVEVHKPLQQHFPHIAHQLDIEAKRLKIDQSLTWSYQFNDLIELCIRPAGSVVAWKQGLGKARVAAALILLKKAKQGLVTMPACLLDEFGNRLRSAGMPDTMWKVIECANDLRELRRINVISNERLRMSVGKRGSRNTYAKKLRGRIGVMVCDEGDFLANPESDQSRAVAQVSAKTLFCLSGTPIANYPRNLINLAVQSVGDGVVGQPYGVRHPLLEESLSKTMQHASRGIDAFADKFVTLEWVTNSFKEDMTVGAKREVPQLRNLPAFRSWLGPFVKRRLQIEPQVRECVKIPVPTTSVTTLDWDDDHLGYYLRVADEFSTWFKARRGTPDGSNLIALLARIGAVEQAAAFPQRTRSGVNWHGGLTSNQQYVVDRAVELVLQGRRIVLFALWPALLDIYCREINKAVGVQAVTYHGANSQATRRENIAAFRAGKADVLCASFGITEAGLDLYEGNYVLFAHRLWNSRGEDQSVYRLLRPQQTQAVHVERVHVEGSIQEYQAQMCEWKAATADAGLDWGTPMADGIEFLHIDTVLENFCTDLAEMRGLKRHALRDSLKALA